MKVKLDNPKMFSDVIGIISELVTEVKIRVSKEGLNIVAIDPANVAMIIMNVPAPAFSLLEVEAEDIGINLESLKAVLKRCSYSSALIMSTEENTLKIEIIDRVKREFNLALIDLDKKDKPVPSLEFSTKIEINSVDFSEAIEDCMIVADSCSFEAQQNNFVISAKGSLNSARLAYNSDEAYIESPSPSRSKYSLEYLQKMLKATKLFEKSVLNFSTDYPLRLEFNAPLMQLSFILAPRVDSE